MSHEDFVFKRDGTKQAVSFDKILTRIKKMSYDDLNINFTTLTVKIIDRLYDGIHTGEIDELTAQRIRFFIHYTPRLHYTSQQNTNLQSSKKYYR